MELFIEENNLHSYLQKIENMIAKSFSTIISINKTIEIDPEMDDKWLSINIKVDGDAEMIAKEYIDFTKKYVKEIPWPENNLIRLDCTII